MAAPLVALLFAFALSPAPAPDSIWLRGAETPCRGRVERSERDSIVVKIARADVDSAERTGDRTWPDRVTVRGSKTPVDAAVVREDAESLTVAFPASAIVRIERDAADSVEPPPAGKDAAAPPLVEDEESASPDEGAVAGRVVRAGRPLSLCRVRAVRLTLEKDFLGISSRLVPVRNEEPREGVTDAEGRFRIDDLAPGLFKLYFCVEGDKNWTRRLRDEPDAEVKAGFVARLKDVDLSRPPR